MTKSIVVSIPHPTYELHPQYPLEVDDIPPGRIISELPIMMFALLINMKRKLIVGVAFFLFVPTAISHNGGRCTIDVLTESHAEIIFMRTCLMVRLLFIEVMVNLNYPIIFIRQS